MNKYLILALFVGVIMGTFTQTAACTCDQLKSSGDCTRQTSLKCKWDDTIKKCAKDNSTTPTEITFVSYCDKFDQTNCSKQVGCQWHESKCSHFTGCTAFNKTTDSECAAISTRCKTDGTHCVEIDDCSTYLKEASCTTNKNAKYCFLDKTVSPNLCVDASKCEHFPTGLGTDEQCRAQKSTCTAKIGGGCQDSGANCIDQKSELQCKWNLNMDQSCFWDTTVTPNACKDKVCTNAAKSLITDEACKLFFDKCTTTKDGGCVTRTTCELATNAAACKTDRDGNTCYYTSTNTCVKKDCVASPTQNETNIKCEAWLSGGNCITKTGGGCKLNGACSVADISIACEKNISGGDCVWNTTCKDKTCANAPGATYNTHLTCSQYSDRCTVNATNNGCADRTCDNAPTADYTSNTACNTFKTGCITKKAGGCRTNTTCADIDLETACTGTVDSTNQTCYWDSTASTPACFAKICANAPSASRGSHTACNQFLPNCTVNRELSACVEMICENIQDKADCTKDSKQNLCSYQTSCYQKQCSRAYNTITTHQGCQDFMNTCTLDNDGKGCMVIPPACSVIKTQEGCVRNSLIGVYNECVWSNNKCQDKICTIAPQTVLTNADCNSFKTGCIVANTEKGCIDPTTTACTARVEVNCYATNGPQCLYDSVAKCIARSCATASQATITTPGHRPLSFSNGACDTYLSGCVLGNDNSSCMSKASACSQYTISTNCALGLTDGKPCYWNTSDSTCVDKQCTLIKQTTHDNCQAAFAKCTYGTASVCAPLLAACGSYTVPQACVINSDGKNCVWANNLCSDKLCSEATDTIDFNTNAECQNIQQACILIDKFDNKGCSPLKTTCSEYTNPNQCVITLSNEDCIWVKNDTCIQKSMLTCSLIKLNTYDLAGCQGVISTCKNNGDNTGCSEKACGDLTTSVTDSACNAFLPYCTNNIYNSACIPKPTYCYGQIQNNCTNAVEGPCTWDVTYCRQSLCSDKTGIGLTWNDCQAISSDCTVNLKGDQCITNGINCSSFNDLASCRQYGASKFCKYSGGACTESNPFLCTDIVTPAGGLTLAICRGFSTICTVNKNKSACVDEYECGILNSGVNCYKGSDGMCIDNGSTCSPVSSCDQVVKGSGAALTDSVCAEYLSGCVAMRDGSACQNSQADCSNYSILAKCGTTSGNQKCFFTTSCVAITGSTCGNIVQGLGTALTNSDCAKYNPVCIAKTNGSACIQSQAACTDYIDVLDCVKTSGPNSLTCFWNSTCIGITSTTCGTVVKGARPVLTDDACRGYNLACVAKADGEACIQQKATCLEYLSELECVPTSANVKCYWNGSCIAITNSNCSSVTKGSGAALTDSLCYAYNPTCFAKADGSVCISQKATCPEYLTQPECMITIANVKCYWNGTCIAITNTTCSSVTQGSGVALTDVVCKGYNSACFAKNDGSACDNKLALCSSYQTSLTCTSTTSNIKCFYNTAVSPNVCIQISTVADCSKVTGAGLNQAACQAYNNDCTSALGGASCQAKSCPQKPAFDYSDNACQAWASFCVSNLVTSPTGCIDIQATCSLTLTSTACVRATEGYCVWAGGSCVKKTCDDAPITNISHANCQAFLPTCTVARIGGCIAKTVCKDYKTQLQCSNGGNCFWNSRQLFSCVDAQCDKVEDAYNTHDLCSGIVSLKCTVKPTFLGCQNKGACSSYTKSEQCITDNNDKPCFWQTINATTSCVDKSCATSTDKNHIACYGYLSTSVIADKCTVKYVSGTATGCQKVSACASYQNEGQCVINDKGQTCVWSNPGGAGTCTDKACGTAPVSDSYDDNTKCTAYLSDGSCTVAASGQGCVVRPDICEGMTQKQCYFNINGAVCEWQNDTCVTKSCRTAPTTVTTSAECSAYMSECILDEIVKCKTQLCEDFELKTDSDCEQAYPGCTSNGINCVKRDVCQAANKFGCVTQITGEQCQWVEGQSACVVKTCATAPPTDDYITESQCQGYLSTCTTKTGKGCVNKTTCTAAQVQSACTKDSSNVQCVWDNGKCRYQVCSDFSGKSNADCQTKLGGGKCSIGADGKCSDWTTCASTTIQAACIEDKTGPCLWISGACYSYTSCKSLSWKSHEQCSQISSQCTTNGDNCLSITLCSETNKNGGCKVGYDSNCIQTVSALGAQDTSCKAFTACTNAYYLTHDECQIANVKCTTNAVTSCAPLAACSTYSVKEACVINDTGVVSDTNGNITVTGKCVWDTVGMKCQDEKCENLTGISHQSCVGQLKGCTSDGTLCLTQATCSTYAQGQCEVAYGTDGLEGKCKWDDKATTTTKCRPFVCGDIVGGTTTLICANTLGSCVSNGTTCILKDKCSTYVTQISCNAGGTDGICVFKASTATGVTPGSGTCSLMTNCASASSDIDACKKASDRCAFTPQSTSGTIITPSKCTAHTCSSYSATNGLCNLFYNWGRTQLQQCSQKSTGCEELDPSTLADTTCYTTSTAYTYTWNSATNKCSACTPAQITNNQTTTNGTGSNTINDTTTGSGYIVGIASVILGYLMF